MTPKKKFIISMIRVFNHQMNRKERLTPADRLSRAIIVDRLEEIRYSEMNKK